MSDSPIVPNLLGGAIVGPGTQPGEPDGAEFDFIEMPDGMGVYQMPLIPEPDEVAGIEPGLDMLERIKVALEGYRLGDETKTFDLTELDAGNRTFIDQALGEGEVSAIGGGALQVQEAALTGVWRLHVTDDNGALVRDLIEVAAFPATLATLALSEAGDPPANLDPLPGGVANAPALITEIEDAVGAYRPGVSAHVINLSLLPLTDQDVAYLNERLGEGKVIVLSRGYGNCRITCTGVRNVWWVQYFNSADAIILNTIEIIDVPAVACAAQEDIEDSAQRLGEIIGVYR